MARLALASLGLLVALPAFAACPYDPDCLSNPYGAGAPYKSDGLMNPYGAGNPYSNRPIHVVPSR